MSVTKSGSGKAVDQNMKESRQLKVSLKATSGHPQIAPGTVFQIHPAHEEKLISSGWAVKDTEDHTKVKPEAMKVPAASKTTGEGAK